MITKFGIYEKLEMRYEPKLNSYVLIGDKLGILNNVSKEFSERVGKIGKVIKIIPNVSNPFKIRFDDGDVNYFGDIEIKCWSKNRKDVEIYLQTKKYNL